MTPSTPPPALRVLDGWPLLVWCCPRPWLMISSAPSGGGLGTRDWVLNATVPAGYDRPDPEGHIAEMAEALDLRGTGSGLLTAVDVRHEVTSLDSGVRSTVTTGVGQPTWAAEPDLRAAGGAQQPGWAQQPGTINAVCWSPVRLGDAALVNAVATVAEAKAQALFEAGVDGTGTCTDATVVACPADGPVEPYGGPRSRIGAALARSAHAGIRAGLRARPGG